MGTGRGGAWGCSLLSVTDGREVGDDHEGPMGKLSQEGWRLQEVPPLPSACSQLAAEMKE